MNLPEKDPAESVVVEFDFSKVFASITSATIAISVAGSVADSAVALMLDGASQIQGKKVLQRVRNGVDGAQYKLRVVATSGADVVVCVGVLPVKTA